MQIEMLDKAGFRWKHDPVSARIAIEHQKSPYSFSHDTSDGTCKRAPLNDEVRKSMRVAKRRGPARIDSALSNGAINDIDVSTTDKDETKSKHFANSRGRLKNTLPLIGSEQDDNDDSRRFGKKRGRPPKSDAHHFARKRGCPPSNSALTINSSNGQAENKVSA